MQRTASQSSGFSKSLTLNRSKYRKITLDTVLAATSSTRSTKETHEAYLARVTHLHLQNKRIKIIDGLEMCTNLKVLYLYDNQIETIMNLDFASLLQYLYLQNNLIKEIPVLSMKNLRKLFLDDNEITVVTGLEACTQLVELTVARQRLPSFSVLQFDPQSLQAIAQSLEALDISGNGISKLSQFSMLYNLRKFTCIDNSVIELPEVETIVGLPSLEEANFIGNPCCKLFKYRDIVIGASSQNFSKLDEISIPRHQQVAVKGLMEHRHKIGAASRFNPSTSQTSYEPKEFGTSEESFGEMKNE
jgi:protein phosphatase 1 regulatory subunit 42